MADEARNRTRKFIFSCTLLIHIKNGMVWWPGEIEVPYNFTDEQAIDHINRMVVEDGTLRCSRLHTNTGEGRSREIVGRTPTVVGIGAIATITPIHIELYEAASAGGRDEQQ